MRGVTFWTEGGKVIGMGHLVRCLNVARVLATSGVPVHFLVNDDPAVKSQLDAEGMPSVTFPVDSDSADRFTRLSTDVVVIDTKKDVSAVARALTEAGRKVILLDNVSGADHAHQVVVPSPFKPAGFHGGNIHSGGDYVIIGPDFIEKRHTEEKLPWGSPLKVLVTMGGADPFNLTEQVVRSLKGLSAVEATVVMGPASEPSGGLLELVEKTPGFTLERDVKDMAGLMNSHHIAFTAVGTTLWELAYMGVPSVVIANYREDERDLNEINRLGVGSALGCFEDITPELIRFTVERYATDHDHWERVSEAASHLVDGMGAVRTARLIAEAVRGTRGREEDTDFMEAGNAQG